MSAQHPYRGTCAREEENLSGAIKEYVRSILNLIESSIYNPDWKVSFHGLKCSRCVRLRTENDDLIIVTESGSLYILENSSFFNHGVALQSRYINISLLQRFKMLSIYLKISSLCKKRDRMYDMAKQASTLNKAIKGMSKSRAFKTR